MAHDYEEEREVSESELNDQVLEVINNRQATEISENYGCGVFIITTPLNRVFLVARHGIYSLDLNTGIVLRAEDSEMTIDEPDHSNSESNRSSSRNSYHDGTPVPNRDIPAPSRQEVAEALNAIHQEDGNVRSQYLTLSMLKYKDPDEHGAYSEGALAEKDHSNFEKTGNSVSADDLDDLFNKIDQDIKENQIPEAKE